ncbi:MAG: hypothetical protein ACAI43_11605 [Phycisphaerae bacterium]|nr:hypothetical protein [Tepidisphaeraceae bacterium]
MNAITFRNKRGETYGVVDGFAFLAKAGVDLGAAPSADAVRRAGAETFACAELHEARLHENAKRMVVLVVKNGVRATDVSKMWIDTYDEAAQRAFVAAVVGQMRPTRQTRTNSAVLDMIAPLILGAFVALIGGIVISTASDMAKNSFQSSGRVGKAGGIAKLTEGIAKALGVTGAAAVFGALVVLCLVWLVAVIRGKHAVLRWRLA